MKAWLEEIQLSWVLMATTIEKGDALEIEFYNYLLDQKKRGELVYGVHCPELCKIHHKKSYYCKEREAGVEFDVVIELTRNGASRPHCMVIFECKNYQGNIQERELTDFSDKLGRIFKHAGKGVIVVKSQLQSGALKLAESRGVGVAKFHNGALDVIAERRGGISLESSHLKSQFIRNDSPPKPLKFSAFHDGSYFASIDEFLTNIDPTIPSSKIRRGSSVPYISNESIQHSAESLLDAIGYLDKEVNLESICSVLALSLQFSDEEVRTENGEIQLGSANFERKTIVINSHDNKHRERFTLAHEIGHFQLKHGRFLRSETIVERDMLVEIEAQARLNLQRLELQANKFASYLLLPEGIFRLAVSKFRDYLGMRDIGFGYIFVDGQADNYRDYLKLLAALSSYFNVSKQAIENRLKGLNMVNDKRPKMDDNSIGSALTASFSAPIDR